MKVDLVVQGFDRTVGLSRYSGSLLSELRDECDVALRRPQLPNLLRCSTWPVGDLETFFSAFPINYESLTGDVLHISTQTMGLPLLYRDYGPTVVTVHDIFPYIFEQDTQFNPIEPWYERGLYRLAMRALRRADHVIAISDATKRTLQEYLNIPEDQISRIYYGVDHGTFRPLSVSKDVYRRFELNPDDKHILYVGSERPRKAVPELIDAFADVAETIPEATLVKVGGPELLGQRKQVEEVIHCREVEDNVVFTGHVEDDLPLLYNLADVYASASYFEGFGLPFVEAMACGTPVVARDQSAMPEVVGGGGVLFNSDQELASALTRLLSESSHQSHSKALEQGSRFAWTQNAQETASVYRSLLS